MAINGIDGIDGQIIYDSLNHQSDRQTITYHRGLGTIMIYRINSRINLLELAYPN